jgi:PilZ domain-containing protein
MTRAWPTAAPSPKRGRRSPRLDIEISGTLSGRARQGVKLVDLSLLGCLVRCPRRLDPGLVLDLRLDIGERPFTAKVKVAESSVDGASLSEPRPRYLAGLEFLSLPAAEELVLRSFLDAERRRRQRARPSPP